MQKKVSIIVPVYNSKSIMPKLLERLDKVRQEQGWNLELIMIDDGSHDGSYEQIKVLALKYTFIKGYQLARNFGHQAAVSTGLSLAMGDYVAIIDDDLQDPPELLPEFIKKLDEGFDVAYGVRRKRKEFFLKVMAYKYFYRILQSLSEIPIPLDSGDFCVMRRPVVNAMCSMHERNPFLRGMRSWVGFKQTGVEYEREARFEGRSGYTLTKLFRVAFDGIFSFSNLPLRLTTLLGVFGIVGGLLYTAYIVSKFLLFGIETQGFITIILMVIFFGSFNLLSLGIIGEYIARIYAESKNRPHTIIAHSTIGQSHE